MVYKITWSLEALSTYLLAIDYLEKVWTEREVKNFIRLVDDKLQLLITQPRLGRPSMKVKNVHRTVIHKRITLVYRHKPIKKEIELVTFWNNWQNPEKLKY